MGKTFRRSPDHENSDARRQKKQRAERNLRRRLRHGENTRRK